jgi:curved DNA-binding protein
MDYKDYYKILGVDKNATEKEIKSTFRKLARKHHPDVNPDNPQAEARFKEVNEAYEVLGDADKRKKYDQLGSDWHRWQQTGGRPGDFDWNQWMGGAGAPGGQRVHVRYGGGAEGFEDMFSGGGSSFSDFFTSIFGETGTGGQRGGGFEFNPRMQQTAAGRDIEQTVEISLTEAYLGATRTFAVDGGQLKTKIPAGAKTGTKVRFKGKGHSSMGRGQPGDLYLRIKVAPDPRFERKNDDLHATVPVDLYTAVLGGQARIPTLSGDVKLKIPAGSQNGQTFRLRGKGMPILGKSDKFGDLYARLDVKLPDKLTPKQRELFEQLQKLTG